MDTLLIRISTQWVLNQFSILVTLILQLREDLKTKAEIVVDNPNFNRLLVRMCALGYEVASMGSGYVIAVTYYIQLNAVAQTLDQSVKERMESRMNTLLTDVLLALLVGRDPEYHSVDVMGRPIVRCMVAQPIVRCMVAQPVVQCMTPISPIEMGRRLVSPPRCTILEAVPPREQTNTGKHNPLARRRTPAFAKGSVLPDVFEKYFNNNDSPSEDEDELYD